VSPGTGRRLDPSPCFASFVPGYKYLALLPFFSRFFTLLFSHLLLSLSLALATVCTLFLRTEHTLLLSSFLPPSSPSHIQHNV